MNESVLRRINEQIQKSSVLKPIITDIKPHEPPKLSDPLDQESLRKLLMENIEEKLDIIPEVVNNEAVDLVFNGIESFVGWYEPLKDKFTESQNIAMATLIQMRDMINAGCGCKRGHRLDNANNYFVTFWTQNAATDMPKKVMEVGNAKSISFKVQNNEFLKI